MTQPQPSPSAALGLDPIGLLARGIANFQSDLAAADGPAYNPMAVDPRLAALTLRLVLHLAEASRTAEDYGTGHETTALDDFIEDIENASNAVIGDPRP